MGEFNIIPYFLDPPDWLDTLKQIYIEIGQNIQNPETKCDRNEPSHIQYRLFNDGNGATLYKKYCNAVKKDPKKQLAQIVDPHGNVVPPRLERGLLNTIKRTPPPNPDAETGYTFSLQWSGGDGSCDSDCNTSFDSMVASPCAKFGGQRNYMALAAGIDTGCGTSVTP